MFKKIEIWILYLILVFVFISYIIFGSLVLREHRGGYYIPIISQISQVAYFLASIPSNFKKIIAPNVHQREDRFDSLYGFIGKKEKDTKYLLFSRYDGDLQQGIVELIDLKNFKVLHTWNPNLDIIYNNINHIEGGKWENLNVDVNDNRTVMVHPIFNADGSLLFQGMHTPLIKINKYSNLEWIKDDEFYHHSMELDYENNIWVCVQYHPYKIDSKYVGNNLGDYKDDGIRKISPAGQILYDKSVSELLIENNMEYLLFSTTDKFKKDPIHLNDIQPVEYDTKYWSRGDVFLSLRNLSMVILYRPATNEILWQSKGNYFFNQHDVDILDDKKISIFDNNYKFFKKRDVVDGNNRVVIYDFETKEYSYFLDKSLKNEDVRTVREGRSQILPNKDLFIQENENGRIIYFNSDGTLKWMNINRANNGNIYTISWSRIFYDQKDIEKIDIFLNLLEDS